MSMSREDMKARYQMFDHFALQDQRNYYKSSVERHQQAARQVNRYRATFAFLTGLCAATAGLVVQAGYIGNTACARAETAAQTTESQVLSQAADLFQCNPALGVAVSILSIMAVVFPVMGALFSTLADLYQWDRLITIYGAALQNIEVADAQSPSDEIEDDLVYRAALNAYAEGTLSVMSDETAQWGQSIRTPPQLDTFIAREQSRAAKISGDDGKISDPVGSNPPEFRNIVRDLPSTQVFDSSNQADSDQNTAG
jgi:hypothetical protein